jgi:hypothetical protein
MHLVHHMHASVISISAHFVMTPGRLSSVRLRDDSVPWQLILTDLLLIHANAVGDPPTCLSASIISSSQVLKMPESRRILKTKCIAGCHEITPTWRSSTPPGSNNCFVKKKKKKKTKVDRYVVTMSQKDAIILVLSGKSRSTTNNST